MNAVTVGPSRYQTWRSTWLGQITERLEQELLLELADPVNGQDVLDLGCGDGVLTEKLLDHGAKVTGLDADPDMIAAARVSLPGVDFRPGNACHLPFSDASFDLITANTLLCLVRDRQDILAEAARVLRPGARLVIGELNRFSLWALIRRLKGWCGSRLWRSAVFSDAASLQTELTEAGFTVECIRGAVFFPPWGLAARLMAPFDPGLGRLTTFGAAFIAVAARKA